MKLSVLAKKAKALPDFDYEWAGPEQFSDFNFKKATETPDGLRSYLDELRQKMATNSMALHHLTEAYRKMRDLMLEAEVE